MSEVQESSNFRLDGMKNRLTQIAWAYFFLKFMVQFRPQFWLIEYRAKKFEEK